MNSATDAPADAFLRLLDPDPAIAEQKYRDLFRRLVKFFHFRQCQAADDLAQETLLRVFQKFEKATISVEPAAFVQGFANNLVHEARRTAARDARRLVQMNENLVADRDDQHPSGEEQADDRSEVFERPASRGVSESRKIDRYEQWRRRLKNLPPDERTLVVEYYSRDRRGRRQLATERGLTEGALRTRVCRIRAELEWRL